MKIVPSLLICALSIAALAQTPEQPKQTTSASTLHLNVVVTPKANTGEPVSNLTQSAFTVLDNGHPEQITSFRPVSGSSDPVKTYLVIDGINIGFTRLAYEREQIGAYLKRRDGKLEEPTALAVVTDTSTESTQGFTTNGHALSATLAGKGIGLRELRRSSGFYGAEDRLGISLHALAEYVESRDDPGQEGDHLGLAGLAFAFGPQCGLDQQGGKRDLSTDRGSFHADAPGQRDPVQRGSTRSVRESGTCFLL